MQIPSSEWINSSFLSLLKKSIGHFLSLYSFNKLRLNTVFLFYPLYFFQQWCRTNYDNQFRKNIFKIVIFSREDIGICNYFALQFSAFPKWHSCSLLKTTLSKMSYCVQKMEVFIGTGIIGQVFWVQVTTEFHFKSLKKFLILPLGVTVCKNLYICVYECVTHVYIPTHSLFQKTHGILEI